MEVRRFTQSDSGSVSYPETVILLLIDSQGGPNVKLSATEDGSVMVLGGDSGNVQVLSRSKNPQIKLASKDGTEKVLVVK